MSISRLVDTDDSGDGVSGTVHNNAWLQALQDKIDLLIGDWTDVSYSAGNFTASAGTWTVDVGDVTRNRYQIVNKTLFWQLILKTTTVSTTPLSLRVAIPSGAFASVEQYHRVDYCLDNGTVRDSVLAQPGDATHLYFLKSDASNFLAATNTTSVYLLAAWELA